MCPESQYCKKGYFESGPTSKIGLFAKIVKFFYATNLYMFKVNDRSTRKRCEICLKLTIKTPERSQ